MPEERNSNKSQPKETWRITGEVKLLVSKTVGPVTDCDSTYLRKTPKSGRMLWNGELGGSEISQTGNEVFPQFQETLPFNVGCRVPRDLHIIGVFFSPFRSFFLWQNWKKCSSVKRHEHESSMTIDHMLHCGKPEMFIYDLNISEDHMIIWSSYDHQHLHKRSPYDHILQTAKRLFRRILRISLGFFLQGHRRKKHKNPSIFWCNNLDNCFNNHEYDEV